MWEGEFPDESTALESIKDHAMPFIFLIQINMDDIVDEKWEWEMYGEEEIFGLEPGIGEDGVDWTVMEELYSIHCGDAPPPPAYPMVVEINGIPT